MHTVTPTTVGRANGSLDRFLTSSSVLSLLPITLLPGLLPLPLLTRLTTG